MPKKFGKVMLGGARLHSETHKHKHEKRGRKGVGCGEKPMKNGRDGGQSGERVCGERRAQRSREKEQAPDELQLGEDAVKRGCYADMGLGVTVPRESCLQRSY